MMARWLAILILLAFPAFAADTDQIPPEAEAQAAPIDPATLKAGMPKDVVDYLNREADCLHWGGEEPTDAKRAKEIDTAMGKLRCNALPDDLEKLRTAHHDDANILTRLQQAEEFYTATE